jgi:hypothetical protein
LRRYTTVIPSLGAGIQVSAAAVVMLAGETSEPGPALGVLADRSVEAGLPRHALTNSGMSRRAKNRGRSLRFMGYPLISCKI